MYFVLGLLAAGLLALVLAPAILRRTARLTRARVESSLPLSLAEIRADKDQLRAEFAVNSRRLELTARRLEEKVAAQAVELGQKSEEAARLSREHGVRTAALGQAEQRLVQLGAEIGGLERKLAAAATELTARDRMLAERGKVLATLTGDYEAAQQLIEEQQLEVVAGNTRLGNLTDQLAVAKGAEAAALQAREVIVAELAGEVKRREALAGEIARLEDERSARMAEMARGAAEVERLQAEIAATAVVRRGVEDRLAFAETALAEARVELSALRASIAAAAPAKANGGGVALPAVEPDESGLAARLAAIESDREALRAENAELRRVGGPAWEAEQAENARLRERLVAVAADIVHLTQAMAAVRSDSPQRVEDGTGVLRKLPTTRPVVPRAPAEVTSLVATEQAPRSETHSLAERIRALQSAARH